jgi:hypothetical protein
MQSFVQNMIFETDKKAEKEIEAILNHLENQQNLMLEILKKLKN